MQYNEVFNSNPVSEELTQKIQAMPKVEIHVHLEGATDAETVYHMAKRNHVQLSASSLEEWKTFYEFRDFNHFIEVYMLAASCMQTEQDYAEMVDSFIRDQASQNILYSEVFLSTSLHLDKFPAEVLLSVLKESAVHAEAKYGSRLKFIPDISRELASEDPSISKRVLDFALVARELGIGLGMGIGGKEIDNPPERFSDIFAEARNQGLHVVAHGGETGGADSVRGAIEALHAERIGHGVRSLEDKSLVALLKQRQIPLEVNPQSNYCLGVVARNQPHPLRELVDAGVYCTVNSDDPPMFSTNLTNEYMTLAAQGFTWDELWQLNLNGLNAAFLNEQEKAALQRNWDLFK
jgi:adenosine deaminase